MELRKGIVYFVCRDDETIKILIDRICSLISKEIKEIHKSFNQGSIELHNDYKILFKTQFNERGCRPEIIYIDKLAKVSLKYIDYFIIPQSCISTRIKPVRIIDFDKEFKYIDLKELIDDEYALESTINKEKIESWNKLIVNTKINHNQNEIKFKREYKCKWLDGNKSE